MAGRTDELLAGLRRLGDRLDRTPERPMLFLEYAAGHELDWFLEVAERLRDLPSVGACVDVGHVGIARARAAYARAHPGHDLARLQPGDPRLPGLAAGGQAAVATALPAVLDLTRSLGRLGKRFHLHLHNGHPLIPVPFEFQGRWSLDPLYGPAGLAAIVRAAAQAGGDGASLTLEIHQAEGRRPLGDAAGLFGHWRDLTNAERMNHWLLVLSENAALVTGRPGTGPLGVGSSADA